MDFEKLHESVKKLESLLSDPQPGLFTWNQLVEEKLEEISNIYYDCFVCEHCILTESIIE